MKGFFSSLGLLILPGLIGTSCANSQSTKSPSLDGVDSVHTQRVMADKLIKTGADRTAFYLPYLKGKRIAIVVNQTSIVGKTPIVDSLVTLGVKIVKIFGPEHGFRGTASNGDHVNDGVDPKTGIPAISLYGRQKKPSKEQLADVDLVIFDIQDVGARFYTYINTLGHVMEACAENGKELMILDRPNPNGFMVDGPVLEDHLHSGIGMYKIPITHGLTMAELAKMINGESWLPGKIQCRLKIVELENYNHDAPYTLPIMPSPNLNTQQSVMLYPHICMFEGTIISQGRGTFMPFTVLGAPLLKGKFSFTFKPRSIKGMSETPLHQDQECYGLDLRTYDIAALRKSRQINLKWLIDIYNAYPAKEKFFDMSQSKQIGDINKLSGTENLKKQIIAGVPEAEIRKSWEPGLSEFKQMRKKYLIYP